MQRGISGLRIMLFGVIGKSQKNVIDVCQAALGIRFADNDFIIIKEAFHAGEFHILHSIFLPYCQDLKWPQMSLTLFVDTDNGAKMVRGGEARIPFSPRPVAMLSSRGAGGAGGTDSTSS